MRQRPQRLRKPNRKGQEPVKPQSAQSASTFSCMTNYLTPRGLAIVFPPESLVPSEFPVFVHNTVCHPAQASRPLRLRTSRGAKGSRCDDTKSAEAAHSNLAR